jgi:hypothetical protein
MSIGPFCGQAARDRGNNRFSSSPPPHSFSLPLVKRDLSCDRICRYVFSAAPLQPRRIRFRFARRSRRARDRKISPKAPPVRAPPPPSSHHGPPPRARAREIAERLPLPRRSRDRLPILANFCRPPFDRFSKFPPPSPCPCPRSATPLSSFHGTLPARIFSLSFSLPPSVRDRPLPALFYSCRTSPRPPPDLPPFLHADLFLSLAPPAPLALDLPHLQPSPRARLVSSELGKPVGPPRISPLRERTLSPAPSPSCPIPVRPRRGSRREITLINWSISEARSNSVRGYLRGSTLLRERGARACHNEARYMNRVSASCWPSAAEQNGAERSRAILRDHRNVHRARSRAPCSRWSSPALIELRPGISSSGHLTRARPGGPA